MSFLTLNGYRLVKKKVKSGGAGVKREREGLPVSLSPRTARNSRRASRVTLITLAGLPIALPRPQWIVFPHAQTDSTLTLDTGSARAECTHVQQRVKK